MKGITAVIAGIVALFLVVGIALYAHDQRIRSEAVATQTLHESKQKETVYRDSLQVAKRQLRVDTIYATNTIRKYTTLRDTLKLTDTVEVKIALERADTAIKGCTLAMDTCSRVARLQDSVIVSKQDQIDALQHLMPTKTQHVVTALKWGAVGAVFGAALLHFR